MDDGELVPDELTIGIVEECLAPGRPARRRVRARRLSRATCTRPSELDRHARRPPPRPRDQPRGSARRSCSTVWPAAGCARTASASTTSICRPPSTGPATRAAVGSCSATTTPKRRSTAGSSCTRSRRCRSSTTTGTAGCSREVDGVGEGDEVFERLVKTVERRSPARPCVEDPSESGTVVLTQDRRPDRDDAPRGARRRRDARGVHPRRQARRDHRRPRRCRTRGARPTRRPFELPRTITASRPWRASRPTR